MRHQQKLSPERIQKQKELFTFTKVCNNNDDIPLALGS